LFFFFFFFQFLSERFNGFKKKQNEDSCTKTKHRDSYRAKQNERKKHFFQNHTQKTNTNKTTKKHSQKKQNKNSSFPKKLPLHFPKHKILKPSSPLELLFDQKKTKKNNK